MADDDVFRFPVPDPTVLTTEQLLREVSTLKEILGLQISANDAASVQRFEVMGERTTALEGQIHADIRANSAILQGEITALAGVTNEKIEANDQASEKRFEVMGERTTALEREIHAAFLSAEKAVEKASIASEKRFESVNEFRAQLSDVLSQQITRAEAEARFNAMDARIIDMKSTLDKGFSANTAGDTKAREYIGYIIGVIGLVAALGLLIVTMLHTTGH